MRNHHEKTRDMARSVLPSTSRDFARRQRAAIHRRERRHVRALLDRVQAAVHPDDVDDDLRWQDRHAIAELVTDRRTADKIRPLIRWAERTVERDPRLRDANGPERVAHFRRLLPDGHIGRHAISHLEWVLDPQPRTPHSGRFTLRWKADRMTDAELRVLVVGLVARGFHGELNRRMKWANPRPWEPATVLHHLGRVDEFIAECRAAGTLAQILWLDRYVRQLDTLRRLR